MSPVFRHGRLRLYLLKLLDDAPKHGYEVIRLLQDRFMGVYAPSPGTIYPRLARLEEEGLVTHDDVDGRKVYRLTDKGRAEINERVDDLAELEEEITESVRDIAREVKEDVRDTVRSLREEIARAAKDVRQDAEREREEGRGQAGQTRNRGRQERDRARQGGHGNPWQEATDQEPGPGGDREPGPGGDREPGPGGGRGPHEDYDRIGEDAGARFRSGRGRSRRDWGDWANLRDWSGWKDWPGLKDWRDWPGGQDWPGPGSGRGPGQPKAPGQGRAPGQAKAPGWPDPAKFRDLERLALQFATELRRLATQASAIGEDAFGDLRGILDEALGRIRTEVFEPAHTQDEASAQERDPGTQDPGTQDANGGSDGKDDLAE